ncbi:rRNA maturation RNase YbeY [Thermomicrobium sp. CFH 73360]|uniref:rRNA maturation RNase YbeY n=1 Tax=Thermomicrobium sp. CFH 73360 TaxID=2951987 RepID=UPI0020769E46|nr:rRNA maturation RNase YbeY [Thermomicrobium sp. CFH 73360]MCM8745167.1 rRNA maturation RNase YbeY [Thermomicrobium sp. CFH 73360]
MKRKSLRVGIRLSEGLNRPVAVRRLARLLRFAAEREGVTGEVGVWICRDDEIAELHERFQGIPGPTDVLSFPGDPPYLGDIAVSAETAALQAAEVGHSVGREIAFLVLHGFLHLIGYDDLSEPDRSRMFARQEELLRAFEGEEPGSWEPVPRQRSAHGEG